MDWFYHDPGQGRVGPLSADEMRKRYRERRLERDTLVWREGLREWQPLDRVADELDLLSVQQDASRPPPLPPGAPMGSTGPSVYASTAPAYAGARAAPAYAARPAPPPRKGMSGCLIALIIAGVLFVPGVAILAAIALPAYNDYVIRSKLATVVDMRAETIKGQLEAARQNLGRCPENAREVGLADEPEVQFGDAGGQCAFQITVRGVKPSVDGKTVVFVAPATPGGAWDCTGGDLPARFRRPQCRPDSE